MQKRNLVCFWLMLVSSIVFAQHNKIKISGIVLDENNEPLPGASVYVDGTTIGTACDREGKFVLKCIASDNVPLRVSFSGYKKYRKTINATTNVSGMKLTMIPTSGNLGEIVVTGTGTPHHIKSAPVPTELITRKEIEKVATKDFGDLMMSVSPSFDFTPNRMGSFIQLNGLGNDYIAILVDGRRMSGDVGGMNDLNRINPADIEKIEVVKGASSSLYGSDAIGGVINIITKKSKQRITATSATQFSDYNTLNQDNSLSFNAGPVSGKTHFAYKKTDGWQLSKYEYVDYGETEELEETDALAQNAYENRTFDQSLNIDVTNKFSINAMVSIYENDVTFPQSVKDYGYFYKDLSYALGAEYLLKGRDKLTFDYHSDRFTYSYRYNKEYKDFKEGDTAEQSEQKRDAMNLRYLKRISKNNILTLGTEYVNNWYEAEKRLENGAVDDYTVSVYGQDEMKFFNALDVILGVRWVNHEEFGSELTPKASLLYRLNNLNFRSTYSRGFKTPTLKELYGKYESRGKLYLGSTDLDPQKSDYFMGGIDYHVHRLNLSVSAYRNNVDGLIEYEKIETTPENTEAGIKSTYEQRNIEEARTQGIDVSLQADLGYGFTLSGGYSYVDAENRTTGERLEYVARHYGNATLGYNKHFTGYDLGISLIGRFQDGKYYDEGKAKSFNLWKLATTHNFGTVGTSTFTLNVGVDNLLDFVDDTPYGARYSTLSPGRTFYAGMIIRFDR